MPRDHCPFRKTILGGSCSCCLAQKTHLPTGCSVSCGDDAAWDQCDELLNIMITSSQFVLHFVEDSDSMTHGKLMKVQHGGLFGLAKIINGSESQDVDDIYTLVNKAKQTYKTLQDIPYSLLLNDIEAWQLKRRRNS